jgi:hypothetical protein
MPRRAQLALALILLLVLAPLAGATCGIACLAATPHSPMHAAATTHRHCVHASACCHASGPAMCAATQAPEAIAAILSPISDTNATHDTPALAILAAESLPQNPRSLAAHSTDSSPPGQPGAARLTPLRV